ncbi:MAG: hypothetical protein AAF266_06995 [Planctomycetota bacterium]
MITVAALLFAIPTVTLSEAHQAMAVVGVGDAFPAAIEGVRDYVGSKATVVALPGGPEWMSKMMAGDLTDDFAPKYSDKGVSLMTLAGDDLGNGVRSLNVSKAKLAEALGQGRGPRVYVLDAAGKIVWFDLEYTLSTHRELHAALDELIGKD